MSRYKHESDNTEIERLEEENIHLHRRNAELEAEILRLRSESLTKTTKGADENEKLWFIEGRGELLMKSRSYPRYLAALIKSNTLWLMIQKGLAHLRRFRLLSGILKILTRIVVLAESGVAFLAWFSVMIVVLPVLGVLSLVSLSVALLRSRNANNFFRSEIKDKNVYILFAHKKQLASRPRKSAFFYENVKDLTSDGSVCFVVSPYFFGRKGLGGDDFYVTARKEKDNIYLVRKNYFFMLRRRVISTHASSVVTIY
ncbi:MAG: hypothetical protein U0M06_07225 [Clostridia bacterium]|nr:hypothetical protein [Clostridia bacterium]